MSRAGSRLQPASLRLVITEYTRYGTSGQGRRRMKSGGAESRQMDRAQAASASVAVGDCACYPAVTCGVLLLEQRSPDVI